MILFVEGTRHSGKTYLIERFLEQNTDPRVEYYKFYFANHLKTLELEWQEDKPGLHYFSLGNIMTIMEMNLRPEYKDKVWIFDRAIISAYTWAVLRNRLTLSRAKKEYDNLLSSDLFTNCKTLFVFTDSKMDDANRVKDHWDGAVSTEDERHRMLNFIEIGAGPLTSDKRNNDIYFVKNEFDQASVDYFIHYCNLALGLNK